jgi:hypothetical protein
MAPPTGPAAATVSVSAHQRAPAAPPSGPRAAQAAPAAPRGDFVPRGRGGFRGGFGGPGFRGGRGGGAPMGPGSGPGFGRGGGGAEGFSRSESFDSGAGAPPAGPRGSFSQQQAPHASPPLGPGAGFRQSSNATTTTFPRSQRFAPNGQPIPDGPSGSQQQQSPHTPTAPSAGAPPSGPRLGRRPTEPHASIPSGPRNSIPTGPASATPSAPAVHPAISSLPTLVPGGQKADPIIDNSRLLKLQEDAEKLRKVIEEKEARRRKSLREWERMSREVEVAGLRTSLAEGSVRELAGESGGGWARLLSSVSVSAVCEEG